MKTGQVLFGLSEPVIFYRDGNLMSLMFIYHFNVSSTKASVRDRKQKTGLLWESESKNWTTKESWFCCVATVWWQWYNLVHTAWIHASILPSAGWSWWCNSGASDFLADIELVFTSQASSEYKCIKRYSWRGAFPTWMVKYFSLLNTCRGITDLACNT